MGDPDEPSERSEPLKPLGVAAGSTTRLFVPPAHLASAAPGSTVLLTDDERHYALRVRRRKRGDVVELLDGAGSRVQGRLVQADERCAVVELVGSLPSGPDVPRVELGLAVLDAGIMASVIAALSELGVAGVTFLVTARAQHGSVRAERVEKLVRAAQRQCGRAVPLTVEAPLRLDEWLGLAASRSDLRYVAALTDSRPSRLIPASTGRGAMGLIGPEGGLTADEVAGAERAGFAPVRLGPWTLRAETAASALAVRLLSPE